MISVLVVDDQALVRAGVTLLLRTAGEDVVGEAADGQEAVLLAQRLRPDVILMDLRMPRLDGIEATRRILAGVPTTRVLMLTTFDDDADVYGALSAGAMGYLLKDGAPDAMIDAVRSAARGEPLLAPAVLARVLARAVQAHRATATTTGPGVGTGAARDGSLTEREREVLALVGAGHSNPEIGRALHLGITTVKTHIGAITQKLELRNRVQAAVVAHRLGLVDDQFQPVDRALAAPPGPHGD
ncbi:response regulator receiver protein [Streptomyces zinciresistens K42]|uniref:Response regulator receiver protein n=1 Tax=Streptomyces zinciresistens K42 TaxID=700597 RepID=G2GNT8_9ACTN|nr:response regulator transcription factor [Streptomyces zinciresistens]EGX54827.1 response regulator receiver protein [Streptomyces zinciresistens K42]